MKQIDKPPMIDISYASQDDIVRDIDQILKAQHDADVAYYEDWYGKLLEDYKRIKVEQAELLDKIQQAKAMI